MTHDNFPKTERAASTRQFPPFCLVLSADVMSAGEGNPLDLENEDRLSLMKRQVGRREGLRCSEHTHTRVHTHTRAHTGAYVRWWVCN